jgi:phosphohistidine swiveling domain-containing protein
LWRWDDIHNPLPASPMSVSISDESMGQGSSKGARELKRPARGPRKRINGYSYSANAPETLSAAEREAQRLATERAIDNTRHRWDSEFLPAVEQNLRYMRGIDLQDASDERIRELLDEFMEINAHHWYIHSMIVFPLTVAVEQTADLYREIMGRVPDEEPYFLFQGIDNKTIEADLAVQTLAKQASDVPEVLRALQQDGPVEAVTDRLLESVEGREFVAKIDHFLAVYGYRPTGFDYVFPSWIEDQSFLMLNLRSYVSTPPRDVKSEMTALRKEAEQMLGRVLDKAQDVQRFQFLTAYERARELWPLKEDHAFYIDQGTMATIRILIVEMGSRLAARGVLDDSDDVFYITLAELKTAMEGSTASDLMSRAEGRRADRERFSKVIPPRFLGTAPADGAAGGQPEFHRMMGPLQIEGLEAGVSELRGVAGSKGKATGPAVVVRSPEELGKVKAGDVLVCTSTSPTWTPLFGTVAALVSDSGGALSHTAIVAREYGLPAVVGVRYGTSMISDGQVVTVDGTSGAVFLR